MIGATIFINRVHFPVTSLGFGSRVGLWFQGCSIQCPGCISRDTWETGVGAVGLDKLQSSMVAWLSAADGLTISGGEPFDQPEALHRVIHWWRANHGGDVLAFSGYSFERIQERHADTLAMLDVLISDPFVSGAGQTLPLRGSDNQRMHLLTPLAGERYASLSASRALDLCVDGDSVWLAGIPRLADMARLRQHLTLAGFASATSDQPVCELRA